MAVSEDSTCGATTLVVAPRLALEACGRDALCYEVCMHGGGEVILDGYKTTDGKFFASLGLFATTKEFARWTQSQPHTRHVEPASYSNKPWHRTRTKRLKLPR